MRLTIIEGAEAEAWQRCLQLMPSADFYHGHGYHELEADRLGGDPVLVLGEEEDTRFLLPLLLRPVEVSGSRDATSAYGYPGLLASGPMDEGSMQQFVTTLDQRLAERDIVSVFVRLHPLLSPAELLRHAGEVVDGGQTVSIDLTLGQAERRGRYRSNHRRDLKKLERRGYACRLASTETDLSAFVGLYHQTMRRVNATSTYFFGLDYFRRLLRLDGLALLLSEVDGDVAAGAVVSVCGRTAQYHLGGTCDERLTDAPMKQVFDQAASWAAARGAERLHLGGGLGARGDALFNFKSGFSPDRHLFSTWRHVVQPSRYKELVEQRGAVELDGFFPAYRAPSST